MRAKAVELLRYFAFSVEPFSKNLRIHRPKEAMGRFPPPGELKLPTGSNTSTQGVDGLSNWNPASPVRPVDPGQGLNIFGCKSVFCDVRGFGVRAEGAQRTALRAAQRTALRAVRCGASRRTVRAENMFACPS